MKLLHCKRCGLYTNRTDFYVKVRVPCKLRDDEWRFWLEDTIELNGYSVKEKDRDAEMVIDCPECEFEEKGTLEVVEVDECPHNWERHWRDANKRVCCLCGIVQEGKVIWN